MNQPTTVQPRRRLPWMIAVVLLLVIAIPVGWWLASPLFVTNTVNESFPFDLPSQAELAALPAADRMGAVEAALPPAATVAALPAETRAAVEQQVQALATLMPAKTMDDAMPTAPAAEWTVAAQGEFRDADAFHKGSGQATIYQQGETRVLRLENFTVTNGPDLHVLLVEKIDGGADMGEYLDLGSLKGNVGNQNYDIPAGVDLSQFSGVMIYCQPFQVVFATAPF